MKRYKPKTGREVNGSNLQRDLKERFEESECRTEAYTQKRQSDIEN